MVSRYDVTLNGVPLSDLAEEIIIRDIVEKQPKTDRQEAKRALRYGSRISGVLRRALPVQIVFNVRAYDEERRAEILDAVAAWAGSGGWLTISTRPFLRLYVQPEEYPALNSSLKWTEDLTMTLTAYAQPYWEELLPAVLDVQTDEANDFSGTISTRGTVDAVPLTAELTNAGDAPLTTLHIAANSTFFDLTGLSVQPGESVRIFYTDEDVLIIRGGENSILHSRTAESSDELLIVPGRDNAVEITADAPLTGTISARGRWR